VAETPRRMDGLEPGLEYPPFDEDDGPVDCDCPVACYRGHRGYRTKHWSSSSASPPPKKKKKKKGSHRRSRKKRRLESECRSVMEGTGPKFISQKQTGAHLEEEPKWEIKAVQG
ncbi:hypothetical protein A6R68_02918, partial [Neotoma lepida]